MKLSKNSWHYKLINFFDFEPFPFGQTNLCTYCRKLLAAMILTVFSGVTAIIIAMITVIMPLVALFTEPHMDKVDFLFIGYILWVVFPSCIGGVWAKRKLFDKLQEQEEIASTIEIVDTYVSSKKEKICPLIEIV